jgi:hypothetical protein
MTAQATTTARDDYQFVGGPYDGHRMPLGGPAPQVGTELLVHEKPGSGRLPEFYELRADGRFYYVPSPDPLGRRSTLTQLA